MTNTNLLGAYGGQAGDALMFRNRVLNGDMRIDQRNSGAALTLNGTGFYLVDRWIAWEDTDGSMTAQQSIVAPIGFRNSLLFTTGTADASLSASQFAAVQQRIEGFNVADFNWGTANAQSVTLSFWVRSSLIGIFGGSVKNAGGASPRSYPFTYNINSANTWEQKTITIPGDTSGTWLVDAGIGVNVGFGLGVGSAYSGTAGSWAGSEFLSATGATSVVGTSGATFYITGVQLEAGPTATPFERRPIGQELQLCQRYYEKSYNIDVVPGTASSNFGKFYHLASSDSAGSAGPYIQFKVTKRSTPLFTAYTDLGLAGSWRYLRSGAGADAVVNTTFIGQTGGLAFVNCGASWVPVSVHGHWTASAEL